DEVAAGAPELRSIVGASRATGDLLGGVFRVALAGAEHRDGRIPLGDRVLFLDVDDVGLARARAARGGLEEPELRGLVVVRHPDEEPPVCRGPCDKARLLEELRQDLPAFLAGGDLRRGAWRTRERVQRRLRVRC